jgi:hypothetical protein
MNTSINIYVINLLFIIIKFIFITQLKTISFKKYALTHDTYLEAFAISKDKQNFKESFLTEETLEKVSDLKNICENDLQLY